jgi:uncharacterized Zn finger protein (UPF0148 family)
MINIKQGKYDCGVSSCVGASCVHEWLPYFCPVCNNQLVHVTKNDSVFCSNHEIICGYEAVMSESSQFMNVVEVLEKRKQHALERKQEIQKQLQDIETYLAAIDSHQQGLTS